MQQVVLPATLPLQRVLQEEGGDAEAISFSLVEVIESTRSAKNRVAG